MNKLLLSSIIGTSFLCSCSQSLDLTEYVDPFIGTSFHAHTFPGPTRPNAMVQLSPDTHLLGWDASSGYHYDDSTIYAFSHTHLSGTGNGDLGDIALLPYSNTDSLRPIATFDKTTEIAKVGYYSVRLENFGIDVELTSTPRVGFHRYAFDNADDRNVLFDLGFALQPDWGHKVVGSNINFYSNNSLSGYFQTTGWADKHKVYYYIEFSEPIINQRVFVDGVEVESVINDSLATEPDCKLYFSFAPTDKPLLMKVALSLVDQEGAKKNMTSEMPNWDFDAVVADAKKQWNQELGILDVESSDSVVLRNFYTALYHAKIAPYTTQDVDGRYLGMDKKVHNAPEGFTSYSVFSLWDTFRALHPLMTIIEPERAETWGEVLVKAYEQGGMIPRWALVCNYTGIMVGYPGMSVLADLVAKDLYPKQDIEFWSEAAQQSSIYRPDLESRYGGTREGWIISPHQYYKDKYGFLPADSIYHSVSWGLECAYYDWCVAKIAESAGQKDVAQNYIDKSKAYKIYYDKELKAMRPVLSNGEFKEPYNMRQNEGYQEGNGFQWGIFVLHDIDELISMAGGKDSFEAQLDTLFNTSSSGNHGADVTGLIGQYAHGNEPSHHMAYLYNWTDSPYKGQEVLDKIMRDFYFDRPEGIVGNEDCGQMSAWYVMSAMGFYQVCPGKPIYALGRPLLDRVTITNSNGSEFLIKVNNNSRENKYVDRVTLNGKELSSLFITHQDIISGGELQFYMKNQSK